MTDVRHHFGTDGHRDDPAARHAVEDAQVRGEVVPLDDQSVSVVPSLVHAGNFEARASRHVYHAADARRADRWHPGHPDTVSLVVGARNSPFVARLLMRRSVPSSGAPGAKRHVVEPTDGEVTEAR